MKNRNAYLELLKEKYFKSKQEAKENKYKYSTLFNDPICQSNGQYVIISDEPIIPKKPILIEEYMKKMSIHDNEKYKNNHINANYMTSTVFKEYPNKSNSINNARGMLREQQERKSKEFKVQSLKTFPKKKNSIQMRTALNQNENDSKNNTIGNNTFSGSPLYIQNTFNRIRNGDATYDLQFRRNYLFKPQRFSKARRDNVSDLIYYQDNNNARYNTLDNDRDFTSIKPNNQSYAHVVALTEEAIRHRIIDNL